MRIALVKQDVYQDLYVCAPDETHPEKVLFSSMGRVGPLGLIAELGGSFFIVREEPEPETQIYREVLPGARDAVRLLKTATLDKLPGQGFKRPGSPLPNGHFAVDCFSVDWSCFDVVITLNVALPTRLVRQFSRTLFCYMIGEANLASQSAGFGYDVCLNQMARGTTEPKNGVIDFPYTFLKPDTLEALMRRALGRGPRRRGIYAEVNTSRQRPVKDVPRAFRYIGKNTGQHIYLHRQLIRENLERLFDAKYFVKVGGRRIRGNSVIEAISSGTLCLLNPRDVIHHELVPPECGIRSRAEAVERIKWLDENPNEYWRLLGQQQQLLLKYIWEAPLASLELCLAEKLRRVGVQRGAIGPIS